jgi:hypothetical protein
MKVDKENYKELGLRKYKDLDLKTIREECDLDFAHFTYQKGMCSCCYSPKDLPKLYWKNRCIPTKSNYDFFSDGEDSKGYTYLLFKNADNGSGHVTKEDYIGKYTCIEWGFPMEKLDKVCSMLQEQLGDLYYIEKPTDHFTCIVIKRVEKTIDNQ